GPLAFHMFIARVVLPYYWVMWMPAFLALVALGVAELVGRARSHRPSHRWRGVLLTALIVGCVAVLSAASARDTYRMLSRDTPLQPSYAAAVLQHSPLVYLRLDERSGALADDASGNGHAGSYLG